MLSGQLYNHYLDDELIRDRESCKRAVESYNNACSPSSTMSSPEKERHFKYIISPRARTFSETLYHNWQGPKGSCGHRTIVESPFSCEYGYNIHLGSDAVIGARCFMQDACPVVIGDRTIVGPNVKFYCITASVDANLRRGSRGNFMAGPIKVEEDCFIGADVIIMPFRTIGKGAVVGAGAVVTRVSSSIWHKNIDQAANDSAGRQALHCCCRQSCQASAQAKDRIRSKCRSTRRCDSRGKRKDARMDEERSPDFFEGQATFFLTLFMTCV